MAITNNRYNATETILATKWVAHREHSYLFREIGQLDGDLWKSEPSAELILAVRDKRACYMYRSPSSERTYFVKVYRYAKFSTRLRHLYRLSQGEKEWRQGIESAQRGMQIPAYLAFGKFRKGLSVHEDYCISEFRKGLKNPTDWLVDAGFLEKQGGRRAFLQSFSRVFGKEVRRLHGLALYHREMKPENLYLDEDESGCLCLGFLDAKHITVLSRPSEEHRIKNLLRTFRMWEPTIRKNMLPRICQKWFLEGYLGERSKNTTDSVWRDLAHRLRVAGDSIQGPKETVQK